MANACVESDDFFDAPEEISSESGSASSSNGSDDQDCSSELQQVGNNELNNLHYDLWSRNSKSIDERRNEFIRKTGFILDRCQTAREGPDDNSCKNPRECNNRKSANEYDEGKELTKGLNHVAVNEGAQDLLWRIQCLGDGREFDVDNEGMSRKLDEVGGDSSVNAFDDFQSTFESSNLVQHYIKTKTEKENDMVCQKKPQCKEGWLKRFSFKAANKFNKDKENKELFRKCKSLGFESQRVHVRSHKKLSKELSLLFQKQEFSAHEGSILAMKFSVDGKYLATCGEDRTLNVWKVNEDETLTDFDLLNFNAVSANLNFSVNGIPNLACFLKFKEDGKVVNKHKKSSNSDGIMIPRKVFQILEKPLHEFLGHEGEILDISWSKNGYLLSASVDKTTRLWKVGCSHCLRVFPHNDFVTCAQFNPMDDSYFISGSIDGIVRIWDIQRCQVVDWIDIKEIVTAICYRPDGKGGIVGSMAGNCTFFEIADDFMHRISVIYLQDKKMLTCKKITGFQFSPNNPSEVVVSSADSLIRILKGADIICKLRGSLPLIDRGSQVLASFTADGQHIVSATDDSNVYIWNHFNNGRITNSKPKNIWSCESFVSHNAMIAVPWHGIASTSTRPPSTTGTPRHNHKSPVSSNHHSVNHTEVSSMRRSATQPEEPETLQRSNHAIASPVIGDIEYEFLKNVCESVLRGSHMWGLVIVTADKDGWIRTYHNYGLPVRYPTRKSLKSSFSFANIRNRCRENCSNLKGSTSFNR